MKKIVILLILISFNLLYARARQYIRITSTSKTYSLDDTVDITVKIVADHTIRLDDMPDVKNLKLTGTPLTSTMQNYQYINGVSSSTTTMTYQLNYIPLKVGTAKVGPIRIKSRGRLFVSNTLKLNITKSNQDISNVTEDDYKYPFDTELFIVAKVNKSKVTIGEQVIVTYELYHRVDVDFAEQPVIPSYKNFWLEELDTTNFRRSKRKIYKGYYFKVTPLARMALFPIKEGELTLPPFKAKFKSDIFSFGASPNKIYRRTSNLVKLKVEPLPEKGKPKNFPSGNIGNYSFSVSVSKNKVKVNEPFTINMKVKGRGNIKNVTLPKLKNIKDFKVYEPTETVNITNKGIIKGEKSISVALKAKKPGKFKSFDLKFEYFNPKTKKYRTIDYKDLEIIVTGKANSSNNSNNNSNNKKINKNEDNNHKISVFLKPISDNPGNLIKNKSYVLDYSILIIIIFLFPILYFVIYIYFKQRYKHISNKDILLMKNAYKKAINSLKNLDKKNPSTKELYGELHSIIISYIEEKFSILAKGLTINQIAIFLEEKNLKEQYIKGLTDTLENSQYIRYSNVEVSPEDKKESINLIRNIIENINRGE